MDGKVEPYRLCCGNVCIFGIDPIGVPVSVVLAHMCPSLTVFVVDLNPQKVTLWNTKQISYNEPKAEEMLKKSQNRNLLFSKNAESAIKAADVIFISMETPVKKSGHKTTLDLTEIDKIARLTAKVAENNKIIVLKSPVPVGTNDFLQRIISSNKTSNVHFQIISAPEFFSTGNAIESLLHPDKVLIGSDSSKRGLRACERIISLYSAWVPCNKIVMTSNRSAELVKLSQNALLAQKIAGVIALSIICERSGGDVSEIVEMMGKCAEVGSEYLQPSFGFGGAHLQKDLQCLVNLCKRHNLHKVAEYWNQVLLINEYQKKRFYKKILLSFYNTLTHRKIAIWGIGFKKNVEITVNSVGLELCLKLLDEGAKIVVCDPKVEYRHLKKELEDAGMTDDKAISFTDDPYKAARKTDAIVVCNEWDELKTLDFLQIYKNMLRPAYIFDGWKCLPHEELIRIGFIVKTVGRNFNIKNRRQSGDAV